MSSLEFYKDEAMAKEWANSISISLISLIYLSYKLCWNVDKGLGDVSHYANVTGSSKADKTVTGKHWLEIKIE